MRHAGTHAHNLCLTVSTAPDRPAELNIWSWSRLSAVEIRLRLHNAPPLLGPEPIREPTSVSCVVPNTPGG